MYTETMDIDYDNLDQAVAAARITSACYKREYKKVAQDYQAGRISPEEMAERVTEIRDGAYDAATILANYNDVAVANLETYDLIVRSENTRDDDRPSRGRINQVRNRANTMQRTQNSASTLLAELDDTRAQSDIMLQSLQVRLEWFLLATMPDVPETDCGPCSGRS